MHICFMVAALLILLHFQPCSLYPQLNFEPHYFFKKPRTLSFFGHCPNNCSMWFLKVIFKHQLSLDIIIENIYTSQLKLRKHFIIILVTTQKFYLHRLILGLRNNQETLVPHILLHYIRPVHPGCTTSLDFLHLVSPQFQHLKINHNLKIL